MMLHNLLLSPTAINSCQFESVNFPEENDETMSKSKAEDSHTELNSVPEASSVGTQVLLTHLPLPRNSPTSSKLLEFNELYSSLSSHGQSSYGPYQPPLGLPAAYNPQTPFPSQAEGSFSTMESHKEDWLHSDISNSSYLDRFSNDRHPSCLVSDDYSTYRSQACNSLSLPDKQSPELGSLEQPCSLHSIPTEPAHHSFYVHPCQSHGVSCCEKGPGNAYWLNQRRHHGLQYFTQSSSCPNNSHQSEQEFIQRQASLHPQLNSVPSTAPLSVEQRKVFVTYEADNDKHVKEVISFVALLRHNGFYTHIDMFEQQFMSISKIDFMERYITEKDYLIIIVISPKYHETVTNASLFMESDDTLNTVYIHKQLQNEFIQNGCRNFRFIPVLFPGAKKCHVPAWLQNTHIFSWPRDRDDILRRLMRVEKYSPPPIGELPTIVSIPI